jgi:HPt (histidine-containing phosphotransfer) domain-containing protein
MAIIDDCKATRQAQSGEASCPNVAESCDGQWPGPSHQGEFSALIRARRPIFLAKRQSDLEAMRTSLITADFPRIERIAHNCKGIGSGYGFPEISKLGRELQILARAQNREGLAASLADFERCLMREADSAGPEK